MPYDVGYSSFHPAREPPIRSRACGGGLSHWLANFAPHADRTAREDMSVCGADQTTMSVWLCAGCVVHISAVCELVVVC
jgi:hypothetical protein